MRLRFGPVEGLDWCLYSYVIAKNPTSPPFVRDLSGADDGSRRVTGQYDPEDGSYVVTVENDAVALLKRLRRENRANYVSAIPYAVNPRNLKAAAVALKTALDGKVNAPLTPEQFYAPAHFTAQIGPLGGSIVEEVYRGLGLEVSSDSDTQHMRLYTLKTPAPMSLTEFLQRVFVGAYALTARDHEEHHFPEEVVDSLIRRSQAWLATCTNAEWVIRQLTSHRKGQAEKFQAALVRPEEPEAEPEAQAAEALPAEEAERVAADAVEEKRETSLRLHERRHGTILRALGEYAHRLAEGEMIVDLGCGEGRLTAALAKAFPKAKILALDAGERTTRFLRRVGWGRLHRMRGNFLYPYLEQEHLEPAILVMSEVIEHLGDEDRELVMRQVTRMWRPRLFALTTPNVAYNVNWGIPAGEFRHKDHQIEYTADDLEREVLAPLRKAGYTCRTMPVDGLENEPVQPSFVVIAERPAMVPETTGEPEKLITMTAAEVPPTSPEDLERLLAAMEAADAAPEPEVPVDVPPPSDPNSAEEPAAKRIKRFERVGPDMRLDMRLVVRARHASAPLHIDDVGYSVLGDEMRAGLAHPVFRHHRQSAFYLSPTMAPVDFNPRFPEYLEHPQAAFDYYRKRGVKQLVEQEKYMGSRCHLLLFRDENTAKRAGHDHPMIATSRGGYPFFDKPQRDALWERIRPLARLSAHGLDFVMLDCEVMPWALKAGQGERSLITREFLSPGEAALLYGRMRGDAALERNARAFMAALSWYAAEGEIQIRPFGLLAEGTVDERGRFGGLRLGVMMNHASQLVRIRGLLEPSAPFREVQWRLVEVDREESTEHSIREWEQYTSADGDRGEGFVYKPLDAGARTPDGAPLQPALKVRGREYLRIIYGVNYLEPAMFSQLTRRRTSDKRRLALVEHVLGTRILQAYLRGLHRDHARLVAAFLGLDGVASRTIDATL